MNSLTNLIWRRRRCGQGLRVRRSAIINGQVNDVVFAHCKRTNVKQLPLRFGPRSDRFTTVWTVNTRRPYAHTRHPFLRLIFRADFETDPIKVISDQRLRRVYETRIKKKSLQTGLIYVRYTYNPELEGPFLCSPSLSMSVFEFAPNVGLS